MITILMKFLSWLKQIISHIMHLIYSTFYCISLWILSTCKHTWRLYNVNWLWFELEGRTRCTSNAACLMHLCYVFTLDDLTEMRNNDQRNCVAVNWLLTLDEILCEQKLSLWFPCIQCGFCELEFDFQFVYCHYT